MQIQAFWLVVSLSLLSWLIFPLPLQYLKFSELIWFLRRNSCKIIILLWHFPYQNQNFLRKLFLVLLFSPIDSKLSNPYTKHVYLNLMFFNISYYRISANSFRGNYSFLNLTICTVTFSHSTYRFGIYSREETIYGNTVYIFFFTNKTLFLQKKTLILGSNCCNSCHSRWI